ncbi:C-type mannose receptor 2 [Merluccius polli]|uniref:C-type mannose receptor 2 n=1 Tax=Merluccius polli TaxID=89951 RepID=A0AA47NU48_MERPO|nr:C-type mannose receptor 2 [Merluccius polli]
MSNLYSAKWISRVCEALQCWIGVHKDENYPHEWRSVHGQILNITNWLPDQPDNYKGEENCAIIRLGKLNDVNCLKEYPFVCRSDNLVLVKENKTWEEASDHCRVLDMGWGKFYENPVSDLLSLHTREDFAYAKGIVSKAQTDEVWIGLRWLADQWLWMDGKTARYMPVCPANGMNCGTLSEKGKQARNCVERRNFFCYQRSGPL